jgi:hypothetical protein
VQEVFKGEVVTLGGHGLLDDPGITTKVVRKEAATGADVKEFALCNRD